MSFTVDEALLLLRAADVFYESDDDGPDIGRAINLNDAFYWGCADSEDVSDEDAPRVAELFWMYGIHGIYYWAVVEKRGLKSVEFQDVNRAIEFVRNEEELRAAVPSSSTRAYRKIQYTIGCQS